jgi:hypothetical protein
MVQLARLGQHGGETEMRDGIIPIGFEAPAQPSAHPAPLGAERTAFRRRPAAGPT